MIVRVKFITTTETHAKYLCEFLKNYYFCEYSIKLTRIEDTDIMIALCCVEFETIVNRPTIENIIKENCGLVV